MTETVALRAPRASAGRTAAARGRVAPGALALLWVAAALISGFTIMRRLDPFDEGFLMTAADRVVGGQWPYADFTWPYGPGHLLLTALFAKALGPSVLWWRLVRSAADAAVAVLAYVLVRRVATPRWALAAWVAAAVTMAEPTSANPFPVALALALGAVLAACARRPAVAGVLAALAAAWRPDFGLMAAAAALAALLAAGEVRAAVVAAVTAAAGCAAAYLPFAIAAGPGRLWDALVASSLREGGAWRLPFPATYHGPLRAWPPGALAHDAKDVVYVYLPLIALAGVAAALAVAGRRRALAPEVAGLAALALGGLAYLVSRADDMHQQPLVVAAAAVVACVGGGAAAARRAEGRAAWTRGAARRGSGSGRAAAVLALPLAAIALVGVANRLSAALLGPRLDPVHVPGVPGIRVPPAEARALPPLVALVQRLVPPGRPIYVAPRRSDLVTFSDPLVYFLVRRPDMLRADVSLQARAAAQQRIVAELARRLPLVVRWTDPLSSRPEPNARGRPSGSRTLDAFLATAYRTRARFGAYTVLIPRGRP